MNPAKYMAVLALTAAVAMPAHAAEEKPAAAAAPAESGPLKTGNQRLNYSLGHQVGGVFAKNSNLDLDLDAFELGFRDAVSNKALMSDEERTAALQAFQQEVMQKVAAARKEQGEKNKAEGGKFLKANRKKKGVVALPSGLQYKVVEPGTGTSPGPEDIVTTSYKGMLIDGTEFDSSAKHPQPPTFPLKNVIKGWQEALQRMRPGAKWTVYIPPELAYGEMGAGAAIGPHATLIFDIELLAVKPAETSGKPAEDAPAATASPAS